VVVTNDGPTLRSQTIRVNIDDELTIEDFTSNGVKSGDDITWSNVTLLAGSENKFKVEVEVSRSADDGDSYRVRAYLNGTLKESETTDVDTDDDAEIDIEVTKDKQIAKVGDNVRIDIDLINDGRDDYENLEIVARLDDKLSFLSANRRGDETSDNRIRWEEVDVDSRDNTVLTLNVRVLSTSNVGDVLNIDIEVEDDDGDRIEESDTQISIGRNTVASSSSSSSSSRSSSFSSSSSSSSTKLYSKPAGR